MVASSILEEIKAAIDAAPPNGYVAELHLQVIKFAHELDGVSGKDFCAARKNFLPCMEKNSVRQEKKFRAGQIFFCAA